MDFSTLVDLDDFYDIAEGATDEVLSDAFSLEDVIGAEEIYEPPELPEAPPLQAPEYEEQAIKIDEMVQKAEEPSAELLKKAEDAARDEGELGIKKFFDQLSEKDKNSMLRYSMAAMGMGASQALRTLQQRNQQQFEREQSDIAYQRRREEEDRAREERRVAGTPQAMAFNVQPRGIIGGGMGG